MFTPFYDSVFSNENFDEILSFENHNLRIFRDKDIVEISFKLTYSTNVFIVEEGSKYYLCLNPNLLTNPTRHSKFFKKLILTRDKYEFIDEKDTMYSVSIDSDLGFAILKNWLKKYTSIILKIPSNKLLLEMSAGIDTRVLSYFWRNTSNTYTIYSKMRPTEFDKAQTIVKYINDNFPVNLNLVSSKKGYENMITLNGANIIHGFYEFTRREDFEEIINNPLKSYKGTHIVKDLCPYYDKEYLKLRCSWPGQLKVVLLFLLCKEKDLYKKPIISTYQHSVDINNFNESYLIDKFSSLGA